MLYHTMCLQKGNFHHCTSDALGPSRRPKKQDLDVPNHVSPLWQTSPLFMHHHHAYGRDKNHLRKRVLDLPNHVSVLLIPPQLNDNHFNRYHPSHFFMCSSLERNISQNCSSLILSWTLNFLFVSCCAQRWNLDPQEYQQINSTRWHI